nr:embryogenesis-associated protein EMB8-like [Tanacetum cinerariifolium]
MATVDASFYQLLFKELLLIPISFYLVILFTVLVILLYILLEVHIVDDIFSGFRGNYVSLTVDSTSKLYKEVVSKCSLLHGRYFCTPWLSSPHLQTILLHLLVETYNFNYKRELFRSSDGGTIALDWLINFDEDSFQVDGNNMVARVVPIVIVIPGLTSDSDSPYIKHIAYNMAKHGYNVVISNHRGLGGVPLTSDCFYTGGRTEDLREVVNHLHSTQPEAPLLVIGTSLGANILVKYLGEDGTNAPIVGAASISNPWDLLMDIARMHRVVYARIADWEGIEKARSVGEFNKATARVTGKFEHQQKYCSSNYTTWWTQRVFRRDVWEEFVVGKGR